MTVKAMLMQEKRKKNVENLPLKVARSKWLQDHVNSQQLDYPAKHVAEITGYDDSTVSLYLSGKRYPSKEFLQEYCKNYNLDFEEINAELVIKIAKNLSGKEDDSTSENNVTHSQSDNNVPTQVLQEEKITVNSSGTKTILIEMDYLDFLKDTVAWQRSMMELMVHKLPDVENVSHPKEKTA